MTYLIVILMLLMPCAAPAHAQFGGLGRALETGLKIKSLQITEDEERAIGALVSEKIRQRYGVVQDQAVHRYVSLVGATLVGAGSRPSLAWQFIVLDTDGVNAFAAPGGFVHITRGALALLESEAELAGVLGHEIVHVTEQHTIGAIKKGNIKDLGLEMSPGGGLTKAALARVAEQATGLVLAGFGRAEELESDEQGIALANEVGYAPVGLRQFLARLAERNKASTEKQGLFASHPELQERLDRLEKQIARDKLAGKAVLDARFGKFITYEPRPQADIAQVDEGAAGLAGGTKGAAPASAKGDGDEAKDDKEKPRRRGFGLGGLLKPGQEEKKSAQVTGSGGSRGVDAERNAKGGSNPAPVAVSISPADVAAFKKDGQLT
jgi:hypothetical protein